MDLDEAERIWREWTPSTPKPVRPLLAELTRLRAALAERDAQVTELARKVRAWAEFGDQWRSVAVRQGKALAERDAEIARLRAANEDTRPAFRGGYGSCPPTCPCADPSVPCPQWEGDDDGAGFCPRCGWNQAAHGRPGVERWRAEFDRLRAIETAAKELASLRDDPHVCDPGPRYRDAIDVLVRALAAAPAPAEDESR